MKLGALVLATLASTITPAFGCADNVSCNEVMMPADRGGLRPPAGGPSAHPAPCTAEPPTTRDPSTGAEITGTLSIMGPAGAETLPQDIAATVRVRTSVEGVWVAWVSRSPAKWSQKHRPSTGLGASPAMMAYSLHGTLLAIGLTTMGQESASLAWYVPGGRDVEWLPNVLVYSPHLRLCTLDVGGVDLPHSAQEAAPIAEGCERFSEADGSSDVADLTQPAAVTVSTRTCVQPVVRLR